ncbi:MAG: L,D-transpeptidase family protein [Patescibacteria group bacterium]
MNILGSDHLLTAIEAGANSQAVRRLTASTVAVSCVMLGFIVALVGYRGAMSEKVLYGVSLGGTQYGGTSLDQLRDSIALRAAAIEQASLTIEHSSVVTSLNELGVHVNVDAAVQDVLSAGREGSVGQQLSDSFSMLASPRMVAWQFEATDATMPELSAALSGYVQASTDAHFQLVGDSLSIQPDVIGTAVDVPATLYQMETTYLRGVPTVLRVALVPSIAAITTTDLEALRPQATALIDQSVELAVNDKHLVATRSDLLSWIRPTRDAKEVELALDDSLIRTWVSDATASIGKRPVDRQVLASGAVVSEGRAGQAVDASATAVQVKTALASLNQKPVVIPAVVTTIEPITKVVAADTTAGLYEGKYVEVDLSGQMLYQYEGHNLIASYRVSTGKSSTPTPIGIYTINSGKSPRAYSASFGLYLPSWMPFIGSSYGLHALPEWPGGYKEGESHLGIPVSHGCVRLSTAAAATVYSWADVGTTVVIHR